MTRILGTFGERAKAFLKGEESRRGLAAIEFAVFGPIICMVMVCTADLGIGIYQDMQVEAAAQAGAQYAASNGFNTVNIMNAVQSATPNTNITASPWPATSCGCPSPSGVTTVSCSATCTDGTAAGTYATVSATETYTTIIPYPMLPHTFTLSAAAMVRLQ